jgi:tetratricopeptide (TPR) repeat protein
LTEKAVEHFYKALQIDSAYIPTLNYLGITYGLLGKEDHRAFELAESYFKMVEHYDPDYPHVHHNLGGVYYQTKRYDLALEEYRKSIEEDEDYLPAYEKMGMTFSRTGQYDSSEYYFRQVIENDPDRFDSYLYLASMLHSSRQGKKAAEVLSQAESHFSDFEKLTEIAKTYAQINRYDESIRLLEKLTENPGCPLEAYITLANLYNQLNKHVQGISILSTGAERNPDANSLIALAETFLQLGASDSAEVYLLNAISRDRASSLAYRKLGTYYLLQDQRDKARQVLEMGLENVNDPMVSLLEKISQN